jgi:branched-chain amino acid transport system permease protein
VIRAGVENRAMVSALGIDVRRAFTLVFAIGGALAGAAGVLGGMYFGSVSPGRGASLLIFAFIVVVIGGLGSFWGVVAAALLVGVVRGLTSYFLPPASEASMYMLMVLVLLFRPRGLFGERIQKFE